MKLTPSDVTNIRKLTETLSECGIAETIPVTISYYLSNTSLQKPLDKLPANVSTMLSQILSGSM